MSVLRKLQTVLTSLAILLPMNLTKDTEKKICPSQTADTFSVVRNDICYEYVYLYLSLHRAGQYCAHYGGQLARISNEDTNLFLVENSFTSLRENIKDKMALSFWIQGKFENGRWKFDDGKEMTYIPMAQLRPDLTYLIVHLNFVMIGEWIASQANEGVLSLALCQYDEYDTVDVSSASTEGPTTIADISFTTIITDKAFRAVRLDEEVQLADKPKTRRTVFRRVQMGLYIISEELSTKTCVPTLSACVRFCWQLASCSMFNYNKSTGVCKGFSDRTDLELFTRSDEGWAVWTIASY